MRDEIQRRVRRKVKAKKGFFIHFGIYLAVGLFFFIMNIATFSDGSAGGDGWWFFYPMLPWMVGLAAHYLAVFGFPGVNKMEERWEKEELEKELFRMREKFGNSPELPAPKQESLDLPGKLTLKKLEKKEDHLYDDDELV